MPDSNTSKKPKKEIKETSPKRYLLVGLLFPFIFFVLALAWSIVSKGFLNGPVIATAAIATLLAELSTGFIILQFTNHTVKDIKEWVGFKKTSLKTILKGFSLGISLYVLLQFFAIISSQVFHLKAGSSDTSTSISELTGVWYIALSFVVVPFIAPFVEEALFRGVLRKTFENSSLKYGILLSYMIPTLFFALAHFQGVSHFTDFIILAVTIVLGLLSTSLIRKSGSIWPSIVMHSTYNLTTVLVGLLLSSLV